MQSESIIEREYSPLELISDNYEKIAVSLDEIQQLPQKMELNTNKFETCAAYFENELSFNIEELQIQGNRSVQLNSSVVRNTINILNAYKSGKLSATPNLGDTFIDLNL